jgi:hypothetical protein
MGVMSAGLKIYTPRQSFTGDISNGLEKPALMDLTPPVVATPVTQLRGHVVRVRRLRS